MMSMTTSGSKRRRRRVHGEGWAFTEERGDVLGNREEAGVAEGEEVVQRGELSGEVIIDEAGVADERDFHLRDFLGPKTTSRGYPAALRLIEATFDVWAGELQPGSSPRA